MRTFLFLVAGLWFPSLVSGLWSLVFGLDGRVVRVVDGDTIVVLTDDKTSVAASHGERTRGLVVPRRRRAVVLSES